MMIDDRNLHPVVSMHGDDGFGSFCFLRTPSYLGRAYLIKCVFPDDMDAGTLVACFLFINQPANEKTYPPAGSCFIGGGAALQ